MIAYTAAEKLLLYPQILAESCGRDLLFSALIDFAVQGVIVWAAAFLCSRTNKTFYELLSGSLGDICARIVYGLFALFFVFSALIPLFEQKQYVHAIFYDTVPSLLTFLPFFVFAVYAGSKGFENMGRCADICLPLFAVSMVIIFAMSFGEVKTDAFLPVLKTPAADIFKSALSSFYRFSEPAYLIMFMGRFRYKKGDAAKITLSYVLGAAVVLLTAFIFYGIYADIAGTRQFAISKISLYFPATDILGRIDLLVLYALEIVMLFALVLKLQLAVQCVKQCTGWGQSGFISLIIGVILAALTILLDYKFFSLVGFFQKWAWIAALIFAAAIPLSGWSLRRKE